MGTHLNSLSEPCTVNCLVMGTHLNSFSEPCTEQTTCVLSVFTMHILQNRQVLSLWNLYNVIA